jgi:EAL and modified HD-GYP domain-containing signal transduction protein
VEIFLARQPIFDKDERLAGYELSYADPAGADAGMGADNLDAAVPMDRRVLEACLTHGLDEVAEGLPAYLPVSRALLEDGTVRVVPPHRVVLELVRGTAPDRNLIHACHALAADGYQLAVAAEDALRAPDLLRVARIVRLTVDTLDASALGRTANCMAHAGVRLLAAHVSHRTARDQCVAAGVDLFEGYRFTQPEVLTAPSIGINSANGFRLLKMIRDASVPDMTLEDAIGSDIGLTYKLLRLVNSAALGGREIDSIGHAIRLVGREMLYRWLSLVVISSVAEFGVDREIAHLALARARLCEHLAPPANAQRTRGSLFLVGLFSMLDALLGVPMPVLVQQLELNKDVSEALINRVGLYGSALSLVESYEAGAWPAVRQQCTTLGFQAEGLRTLYTESIQWARTQLRSNGAADGVRTPTPTPGRTRQGSLAKAS